MKNDPFRIIVCATDLSEASRCALVTAIELASRNGGTRLHVLHVREGTERIETVQELVAREEARERELQREVAEELEHVKAARSHLPLVEIETQIRYGKAYQEILRYSSRCAPISSWSGRTGGPGSGTRSSGPSPSVWPVTRPAT